MATYKDAGVDVEAGYEAVRLMKDHVKKTYRPEVMTDIGGFGGLFALNSGKYKNPILVSGTDGVGTKLKVAFLMNKYDTVGIDCVAMCVNDIVCSGAEPLFFLDYIAVGKNQPQRVADIVKGISEGCIQAGCALIGGETAEMPGFYEPEEFDIAGFVVGIVEKDKIIDGSRIADGDVLIGLASSGIHSNGYSLVRKLFNLSEEKVNQYVEKLGCTIGEELLKPTKIYVKTILDLIEKFDIKGLAHITGGGFIENIPRMLPEGTRARVNVGSWPVHPIFQIMKDIGCMEEKDMYNTFNMGIGMVMAVPGDIAQEVVNYLNADVKNAYIIGDVVSGEAGLDLC
jgi:phosphoribosylformylglycinamidine cyclo-ligase